MVLSSLYSLGAMTVICLAVIIMFNFFFRIPHFTRGPTTEANVEKALSQIRGLERWIGGLENESVLFVRDPFNVDGKPYQIIIEVGTLRIYSFGPDRDNDRMTTLYSPTNGLISDGDLFLQTRR